MEYIVEDKDKEMVQTIKAHTTAALREKVVKAIIVSVQTGYAHPDLIKAGALRKTRSKGMPVVTTDYGEALLRTTSMGLTYVSLGKL